MSEAHARQIVYARSCRTARSGGKQSASLKAAWAVNPERWDSALKALHSPESRAKVAQARRRHWQIRFWEKVEKRGPDECWYWKGADRKAAYGQLRVDGKAVLATHLALLLDGRPRPAGLNALHSCDTPGCVNPAHLRWGTQKENSKDCFDRGRACIDGLAKGHAITQAAREKRQKRSCEQCGADCFPNKTQLVKNRNFFCSVACSVAWQKRAYTGVKKAQWYAEAEPLASPRT